MDILPADALNVVSSAFKILFFITAGIIVLISYFQAKEARKMESKLKISLPGSVNLAISLQLGLSFVALFASIVVLILF